MAGNDLNVAEFFLRSLSIAQLAKKFPTFYKTQEYITDVHNSSSQVPILSPVNPVYTLQSVSLAQVFLAKLHVHFSPMGAKYPAYVILLIFGVEYKL
jgi:hypothetical protein